MRMVFVTQSPVLTNEVKQYYASLKEQLAAHLLIVEKAREEKKNAASQEEENKDQPKEGEEESKADNQAEAEAEREKLLKFLEIREKEILQAEQVDQQLAMPEQMHQLSGRHFPLFLTVQRLVYMLDASLYNSFFTRKSNGKIIGMESSLGWHSEDRGVFMINQDFKQSDQIRSELQEFELAILAGDKVDQIDDFGAGDFEMDILADAGD